MRYLIIFILFTCSLMSQEYILSEVRDSVDESVQLLYKPMYIDSGRVRIFLGTFKSPTTVVYMIYVAFGENLCVPLGENVTFVLKNKSKVNLNLYEDNGCEDEVSIGFGTEIENSNEIYRKLSRVDIVLIRIRATPGNYDYALTSGESKLLKQRMGQMWWVK